MIQNYINHVALVLDASASMRSLVSTVGKVADGFISHLAQRSRELDQETRVSVYQFSGHGDIRNLVYDKDVLRLPSIQALYHATNGQTALLDATLKVLADLGQTATLYGDHSFLTYVLTDGEENDSHNTDNFMFPKQIGGLQDNWTLALFVPNAQGVYEAKKFGFPAANVAVWDTDQKGAERVGQTITAATDAYMVNRAKGVRGSKSLFTLDTASLDRAVVQMTTTKLGPGQFRFLRVGTMPIDIATFVEIMTGRPYRLGEAFYQLTKRETIQAQKAIALYDRKGHSVFVGPSTRQLLGLPTDGEVKVKSGEPLSIFHLRAVDQRESEAGAEHGCVGAVMIHWLDAPRNLLTHQLVMSLDYNETMELIEHCIMGGIHVAQNHLRRN
jgi:hypothetical protein